MEENEGKIDEERIVKIVNNCTHSDLYEVLGSIQRGSFRSDIAVKVLGINWAFKMKDVDFGYQTIEQNLSSTETPMLSSIKLYKGKSFVVDFIHTLMIDFISFFAVSKGTTGAHVKQIAQRIYKNYYYFSLAEIKFIFDRGLENVVAYGSMDGTKVYQLFVEYEKERTVEVLARQDSNHKSQVWDEKDEKTSFKEKLQLGFGNKTVAQDDRKSIEVQAENLKRNSPELWKTKK